MENPTEEDPLQQIRQRLDRLDDQMRELTRIAQETRALVGPFGVTLPDGTILVQTLWGHKLVVDALDLIMTPNLVVYRQWEPDLSRLVAEHVSPDTVFVDVGANVGYFTCLAASRIGPGGRGRVIAVEPHPHCLALLERNLTINWSLCPVTVERAAASDAEGIGALVAPRDRLANAHLGKAHDKEETVPVLLRPLDRMLEDVPEVDLLKIDVEGHEQAVLLGARDVIRRSPNIRILMEWSTQQLGAAGTTPDALLDVIADLRLVPCRLPVMLRTLEMEDLVCSRDELRATPYANILLVCDDRLD